MRPYQSQFNHYASNPRHQPFHKSLQPTRFHALIHPIRTFTVGQHGHVSLDCCPPMKAIDSKPVILPFSPHRLISLADMIEYFGESFLPIWQSLDSIWCSAEQIIQEKGVKTYTPDGLKAEMKRILAEVKNLCGQLQLSTAEERQVLFSRLLVDSTGCSLPHLQSELRALQATVSNELSRRKFAFIPPEKVEFFETTNAFGLRVCIAFPSAEIDIKAAGNCLAADLDTAAIFHLMRVAEIGLRALARHLRVRVKNKP